MKRAAVILFAFAAAAFVSANPLPEPAFPEAAVYETAAAADVSGFPLPVLDRSLALPAAALWGERPDPAGLDFFDPSLRVSSLWAETPSSGLDDPFSPALRLSELWSVGPFPAFDRGVPAGSRDFSPAAALAQESAVATDAAPVDEVVLRGLLNNEHYRESIRLKRLAEQAFDYGDYDASAAYAAEAAAAARRSDDYVALRLKIRAVDEALAKAKARLDWAASVGAERTYAKQYAAAAESYEQAKDARAAEDYDRALELARKALDELASVRETVPLPERYKVRPWAQTKDCFWTIAGYPWVYGDPTKWPLLYEANKAKLPRPNNPDLVRVGTILTIPSIRGEYREGIWQQGKVYTPLSSGR